MTLKDGSSRTTEISSVCLSPSPSCPVATQAADDEKVIYTAQIRTPIHLNQFLSSHTFLLAVQMLTDWVDGDKWNCFVRMAWGEEKRGRERERATHGKWVFMRKGGAVPSLCCIINKMVHYHWETQSIFPGYESVHAGLYQSEKVGSESWKSVKWESTVSQKSNIHPEQWTPCVSHQSEGAALIA